jgi:hypothetical protein
MSIALQVEGLIQSKYTYAVEPEQVVVFKRCEFDELECGCNVYLVDSIVRENIKTVGSFFAKSCSELGNVDSGGDVVLEGCPSVRKVVAVGSVSLCKSRVLYGIEATIGFLRAKDREREAALAGIVDDWEDSFDAEVAVTSVRNLSVEDLPRLEALLRERDRALASEPAK